MSRSRPPSRVRKAKTVESKAMQMRKRVFVKPERIIQADRYGNIYYASRRDSTIGCMFEAASNTRMVDLPIRKPVGLVDERLTPEVKIAMIADEWADMLQAKAIRKLEDKSNGLTVNTAVALGKLPAANPHGMFDEHGSRVTGPHIMAKLLSKWNIKGQPDENE